MGGLGTRPDVNPRVVIVGGGPAGLAAAATLAAGGAETVVLEAHTYPRHRMCGEFLSPDAAPVLSALGLGDLVAHLRAPRLTAVRSTVSDGGRVHGDLTAELPAYGHGVSRLEFDAALAACARRAGADVRERVRVGRVDTSGPVTRAVAARGEYATDALLVATGRAARPRGATETHRGAARAWIGVKRHVRGPSLRGVVELHFVRGAYIGLNEVVARGERVVNVCGLVRRQAWDDAGSSVEGVLEWAARESPALAVRLRVARPVADSDVVAAAFDFDRRGAVAGGHPAPLLVIGDAAGAIVPLSGAGQALALAAGRAAGVALLEAFGRHGSQDPAWISAAAEAWRRNYAREHRPHLLAGAVLQSLLIRPLSGTAVLRAASLFGGLSSRLFRATRGPLPDTC